MLNGLSANCAHVCNKKIYFKVDYFYAQTEQAVCLQCFFVAQLDLACFLNKMAEEILDGAYVLLYTAFQQRCN